MPDTLPLEFPEQICSGDPICSLAAKWGMRDFYSQRRVVEVVVFLFSIFLFKDLYNDYKHLLIILIPPRFVIKVF